MAEPPSTQPHPPTAYARATLWIAATYLHFLIFAQFGFLQLLAASTAAHALKPVMAGMALGGILGSALTARHYRPTNGTPWRRAGFILAGLAAALAPGATGLAALGAIAGLTGLGLGVLTVSLAGGLAHTVGRAQLGRVAGLGTGLAYASANLPWLFQATPTRQSLLAAGACALGVLLAGEPRAAGAPPTAPTTEATPPARRAAHCGCALAWVAPLLALVWFDSAAFYIIQHNTGLRGATWEGLLLWSNAASHLLAALATGWYLDRRGPRGLLLLAWLGLTLGVLCLASPWPRLAALPYTLGVSIYSVALIAIPARARDWAPGWQPAPLAAWIYGVAGWLGSGLGIGMAEKLGHVPSLFLILSGLLILGSQGLRRSLLPLAALALLLRPTPLAAAPAAEATLSPELALGRAVYQAEGCIACHSQYIRPGTHDGLAWGPERPLDHYLQQSPPLIGNRRQGPDLTNVGNRRGPVWQRLHLESPRLLVPGSRMPAYAALFAANDPRGPALVAYLQSLGAETRPERHRATRAWVPPPLPPSAAVPSAGAALFARHCASCHGPEGRGDGPAAAHFSPRPRDLQTARWNWIQEPAGSEAERRALARLIRFGQAGTEMPGHETLGDLPTQQLAAYVQGLGQQNVRQP